MDSNLQGIQIEVSQDMTKILKEASNKSIYLCEDEEQYLHQLLCKFGFLEEGECDLQGYEMLAMFNPAEYCITDLGRGLLNEIEKGHITTIGVSFEQRDSDCQ